jgi:hypothetical protein
MSPSVRFELCDLPPPQQAGCAGRPEGVWEHYYRALCPDDCAGMLGNGQCDLRCNISSCAFDHGDCGVGLSPGAVFGGYVRNATDCPVVCYERKRGDSTCERECYTLACGWGKGDCEAGRKYKPLDRCADGCLPADIDDKTCNEACNTAACGFDGATDRPAISATDHLRGGDCDHGFGECYKRADGTDYRGAVDHTADGRLCSTWERHWERHAQLVGSYKLKYDSSLGGHNRCRNPRVRDGKPRERPWCWVDQGEEFEWGYCAVANASERDCNQWQEPASALEVALNQAWRASIALIASLSSTGALLVMLVVGCVVCCLFGRQRQRYRELESEVKRMRAQHLADTITSLDRVSTSKEEGDEGL